MKKAALCLVLSGMVMMAARGQERAATYEWGAGLEMRAAPILEVQAPVLGVRAARQAYGRLSYGIGAYLATRPAVGDGGFDEITKLWYLGPNLSYADLLAGPMGCYTGITAVIGSSAYQVKAFDWEFFGSGKVAGLEPEAGLLLRLASHLEVRVGISYLWGDIQGTDLAPGNGVARSVSLRLLR